MSGPSFDEFLEYVAANAMPLNNELAVTAEVALYLAELHSGLGDWERQEFTRRTIEDWFAP